MDRPELLAACKSRVVILDTLVRWLRGRDENSSQQMAELFELMTDLLSAGAAAIVFAHHSIKGNVKNPWTMTAECVFRGSGDIIANLAAGHGIYQLDCNDGRGKSLVHVECVKPRDFEPKGAFQIQGLPYTKTRQDFVLVKPPGECDDFKHELGEYNKAGGGGSGQLQQILTLKAAGKTHNQIAAELKISVKKIQRILAAAKKGKAEDEEAVDE